jgi:pimeloyl-ACP methyl ester carboxylesterase
MGGFVGMRLAARRPDLLMSLTLLNTSAEAEGEDARARYNQLAWAALALGPHRLVDRILPVVFGRTFLADAANADTVARWREALAANSRLVFRAVQGVIQRESVLAELPRIECPTLVVAGEEDVATPPPKARRIHEAIVGSQLVRVPTGHSSTIERPDLLAGLIGEFLDEVARRATPRSSRA